MKQTGERERTMRYLAILLLGGVTFSAWAAPMSGERIRFAQPDGTVLQLEVFGDEFYAETRTLDGYTVVFDPTSRAYYYAELSTSGDDLVPGSVRADRPVPAGLPKERTISRSSRKEKVRVRREKEERETGAEKRWNAIKRATREKEAAAEVVESAAVPDSAEAATSHNPDTTGDRVGLTILVEFSDEPGTISRDEVDDYCNMPGYTGYGNYCSVYDYFHAQSDGRLRYNNVVTPYVMAPYPKSYYNDVTKDNADVGRLLLRDVLQILKDDGFDFSVCTRNDAGQLHAVNLFFAGGSSGVWSWGLWPFKGSLNPDYDLGDGIDADAFQITSIGSSLRLGTFCHENGHLVCGFPDLYDYDGDSHGCGKYTLMNTSGSTHPPSVGAYLRYQADWAEVISLASISNERGCARLDTGALYQYPNAADPAEYFLMEYRRYNRGWEAHPSGSRVLPDNGLLIMHCDENGDRDSQEMTQADHYEASVEQADGLFSLENEVNRGGGGDLFHNGDKTVFDDSTLPNAKWWAGADGTAASGTASGMDINTIGDKEDTTITFVVGSSLLLPSATLGVGRTLLEPRCNNGASPAASSVSVWNKGSGTLNYSATASESWMLLSGASGSLSTATKELEISYNTSGLTPGIHTGSVTVVNTGNPSDGHVVEFELTVEEPPSLRAVPSTLAMTGAVDHVSGSSLLTLGNSGGSDLSYSISAPSWCTVSVASGVLYGEGDVVGVSCDAAGLGEGVYHGTISIAYNGSTSPLSVPVSLVVEELLIGSPAAGSVLTNLAAVSIEWDVDEAQSSLVNIALWRGNEKVLRITEATDNGGLFNWTVPETLNSATNYSILVSGVNGAIDRQSGSFTICRDWDSLEDGLVQWVNDGAAEHEWTEWGHSTPSSSTGPYRASDGFRYAYTEASSHYEETASLERSFALPGSVGSVRLNFDYHMYGASMGSLHVDLHDGVQWHADIWSRSGQQQSGYEDAWNTASVDLAPYLIDQSFTVAIRGVVGDGYRSDLALDNIQLHANTETLLTNGVPSIWLAGYGLAANAATALADSDGDGVPNCWEFHAGTSPIDANSRLSIDAPELEPAGIAINWNAVFGKTYAILQTDSLQNDWSPIATGIAGIEPQCSTNLPTASTNGFFKVEVEP